MQEVGTKKRFFFSDLNMIKSVLLSYVYKYILLISISTLSLAL